MKRYKRGTSIRLEATIKNADGDLVDPNTSVKVTVIDSAVTTAVNAQTMTKVSTGIYYYDWQTTGREALLIYKQIVTAVDGSYTSIDEDNAAFEIYA